MISEFVAWAVGELVLSKADGKISLTRLAAVSAHFLAAIFFVYFNCLNGKFELDLWVTYLGFATGHAAWDKFAVTNLKGKHDENN